MNPVPSHSKDAGWLWEGGCRSLLVLLALEDGGQGQKVPLGHSGVSWVPGGTVWECSRDYADLKGAQVVSPEASSQF